MMSEEDLINPVSFYAETKIKSEDIIKNTFDNFVILRTSLLFGMGKNHSVNNFHNMILSFRKNKKVKLFYDQYRTPLSLNEASEIISQLINNNIRNITINFRGMERISRTELGEIVCREGGFDTSLIERTSMYDIPDLHKVADVSMNTDKLNSLVIKRNSLEESVTKILKDLL
ncbi:MAG: sugar nucleotide-binding protein [Ignavibacteria bacterium]|nr:sugar nucleotide-binding protein [Ignavibacteria bacterium]